MTKQLIFVCGNLYPFNLGGAEVYNYYLMEAMAQKVKVLCINPHTNQSTDSIKHHKISTPFLPVVWFPLLTALQLLSIEDKRRAHLVLTFSRSKWIYWMYYPILKKLFGLRYTIIIHGGGLTKWSFELPFKWFFKSADNIVGISERIKDEYEKRTGAEVKLLPPLIPFNLSTLSIKEARQRLDIPQNANVVLQVGSLKEIKHPETAVEAFKLLGKSFLEEYKLLMLYAGDGPSRVQLEELIESEGLNRFFRFLGNVPREEVKHVYKQANLFVIASDFEGTPLSMLEAMANNIPVLASNAPGINAVIEDNVNGRLFTIGNGKELAEHLKTILTNPEIATNLTQNAEITIREKFDHGAMLEQLGKMWNL